MAAVGRDSVSWENIPFPESWAGETRGTFTIAGIYIDATSVSGERLEVTVDMTGDLDTTGADTEVLSADVGPVSTARVDQALDLEFAEDNKAKDDINACTPGEFDITISLEEGFGSAWADGNDILLMVSSGTISAKDTGPFDVTAEGQRFSKWRLRLERSGFAEWSGMS